MASDKDIAIVGMSCYFPGATSIREYWNNLLNGVSSITGVPENRIDPSYFVDGKPGDTDRFYFNKGGFVPLLEIDPLRYGILPIAAEGTDPEHLAALHLVEEALIDAGVYEKNIPLQNACFVMGKGNYPGVVPFRVGGYTFLTYLMESVISYVFPDLTGEELIQIRKSIQSGLGRYQADTAAGTMPNMIVSMVANKFDLKGPAYTIDGACASSLLAVEHASNLLLSGQCDIALAGGMHLGQGVSFWSVFNVIGAASSKGKIAPFSEDADGLLIGEGAGIIVLKKLDKAIADNDRIYAVIKACASGSDGSDVSVMAPSSKGQIATLKLTWEKSGMDPKKIGYVETHGTATQVGDRTEMNTLTEFFGDNTAPPALLGSVKSNIGHAMPAAGMAGLIKTVLALYYKKIPPTLNCEKPIKAMYKSRFLPVQQLTDWDEEKYPLVAAVNAFGFGGINTHIILEPYTEAGRTTVPVSKTELLGDKVISLSAQTKEELLSKLDEEDYTVSEGDYRLVIFNPTADKLNRAKTLIEKDKPWKGRLDIWFSNQPLLSNGEKVVFMFTGFDAGSKMETESITDYFDFPPIKQVEVKRNHMLGHSINHLYRCELLDKALKKMGLTPNINIGHSVGEWHAGVAAGCVTHESVEKLVKYYDPEDIFMVDAIYVAVGCGYDKIKPWCEEIPDLYVANDNCPSQIFMAGKEKAIKRLTERLKEEQIFYQIMPYRSGYHTPLFPKERLKRYIELNLTVLEHKEKRDILFWSSTTLEEYPKDREGFFTLFIRHMQEPVRFRELIETLYDQQNARVFIQIGVGPLTGFTEDTLKEKPASIISTVHPGRSGLEQIRRIAALMFIEGKTVNKEMIGIVEKSNAKQFKMFVPLDFTYKTPDLKNVVNQLSGKAPMVFPNASAFPDEEPETEDVIIREATGNLREIAALQKSILDRYRSSTSGRIVKKPQTESPSAPAVAADRQRAGSAIEKTVRFDLIDHPYLLDHMIVRQPDNRPPEELNPVIPFSMTIEILGELTQELVPNKKVLRVSSAGVYKWMSVTEPFVAKLTGQWKTEDCISWMLPGYAYGDITLGDTYPAVPEEYAKDIDLGDNIVPAMPKKNKIYSLYLFHGPKYQSIIDIFKLTGKGLRAHIHKTEGKGSLLDNLGQLLGLYSHFALTENQVTIPMSVDEILFYQDYHDQKGIFDYTLVVKEINENEIVSNVVIKRDGKVWCVANGFHNSRLGYNREAMNIILRPKLFILAKRLNDNVFCYYPETQVRLSIINFFCDLYLNASERKYYDSLYPNQARDYLISRIALKDGVRKYIQKDEEEELLYPIEISVRHDDQGKPFLYGHEKLKGFEVSIAHKGTEAVVIVSDKPVGIDIEKIENRSKEFMEIAFTPQELDLLKEKGNEAEWIARFWVAKEAYGKMLGLGLQGNPKQYEIESVTGEELKIKKTIITTAKHRVGFIIGWTN